MFERLDGIIDKYNELSEKLTTEEVFNDYNLLKKYSRRNFASL